MDGGYMSWEMMTEGKVKNQDKYDNQYGTSEEFR